MGGSGQSRGRAQYRAWGIGGRQGSFRFETQLGQQEQAFKIAPRLFPALRARLPCAMAERSGEKQERAAGLSRIVQLENVGLSYGLGAEPLSSEERRVGQESGGTCISRWSPYNQTNTTTRARVFLNK